jgi:hypothetical protein
VLGLPSSDGSFSLLRSESRQSEIGQKLPGRFAPTRSLAKVRFALLVEIQINDGRRQWAPLKPSAVYSGAVGDMAIATRDTSVPASRNCLAKVNERHRSSIVGSMRIGFKL